MNLDRMTQFFTQLFQKRSPGGEGMTDAQGKIVMYGTSWCYETRRARAVFDQNHIVYEYIDIDYDEDARKYVESVNRGYRSVPTIVFPDGSILVEPSATELNRKLGLG